MKETQAGLGKRIFRLFVAIGVLVLVVYLARIPVRSIPAFKTYAEAVEQNNLVPGALYYSDVPVTLDAENRMRAAVRRVDDANRMKRAAAANGGE